MGDAVVLLFAYIRNSWISGDLNFKVFNPTVSERFIFNSLYELYGVVSTATSRNKSNLVYSFFLEKTIAFSIKRGFIVWNFWYFKEYISFEAFFKFFARILSNTKSNFFGTVDLNKVFITAVIYVLYFLQFEVPSIYRDIFFRPYFLIEIFFSKEMLELKQNLW